MDTGFTTELANFPRQMYYLRDPKHYTSRVLVNVERACVHFPDSIAPQLWIEATAVDGSFAVADDGRNFRQLPAQQISPL